MKTKIYYVLGVYFLFLQGLIIYANYMVEDLDIFFWFCNHVPFLFAIAFFLRRDDIVKALVNFGFLGQFVWGLDFVWKLFLGDYLFGITQYVFLREGINVWFPILIHLFSTNVAFLFICKVKPERSVLRYSFVYMIGVFILTVFFTKPFNDINCVFNACSLIVVNSNVFVWFWCVLVFFLVILPTYFLQVFVWRMLGRKGSGLK